MLSQDYVTTARTWIEVGYARTALTCAFEDLDVPESHTIMALLVSFSKWLNLFNHFEKEAFFLEKEANAAWIPGKSASQLRQNWDTIQRKRAALERVLRYKNQLQADIDALRSELIVRLNELIC